jgi:hypothetical protein
VTGAQLESIGACVTGSDKIVVDGSFGGDHGTGGVFVVRTSNLAAAAKLAKGFPVLQSAGTLEVRPVIDVD